MNIYYVTILLCYFKSINMDLINTNIPESSLEKYHKSFDFYKSKYGKKYYTNDDEKDAFLNFIDNSKKVEDLNAHNQNSTYYVLDRYADIDTEFMEEHYGVSVNPIASEPFRNIKADIAKEVQRSKQEKVLEDTELFDLDKADEYYTRYLKMYNKPTPKNKYQQQQQFLKFVKSLVALNRNHVNGDGKTNLDQYSDVIKEPKEISY